MRGASPRFGSLLGLALWAGGCCTPPAPPAVKFFDRVTPTAVLKGFVYSVDVHQWDYAYESLSRSSRQEVGSTFKLEIAIRFLKEPQWRVPIYDLISDSVRHRTREVVNGDSAWIIVRPRVRDDEGTLTVFEVRLWFVREDEEWRLDFINSVREMQERLEHGPRDLTRRW